MSQKIEIRKNKIKLPIKDDLDKIHYLSTLSDKRFQNKLSHINDNLDKITEKIKEFVELLSSESRKNDEYISEKIYESLQEIFKVAKNDTEIDFNKLKQKIIDQLDKHLTISKNNKIKTEIKKYIEENISKEFSTPSNQNNQTTSNKTGSTSYTQKTINVKLPKKDTKQIYNNILTNSVFINKINKKIKDTCTTVLKDLKIKNVSKSNLKASKTNKLVLRTFLTNYNSKVEKTIVQTKKSIDKETTKTRTIDDIIRSKIKRVVQKIKRFIMKINPINWYKKARNKLRKLKKRFGSFWGTTFFIVGVPIFLFKIAWKIASFISSIAFKIAKNVVKIAFKLLATVAKLALKVITTVLKTTFFILKGVFKIVTKTLGIVVSIIKKVFNIAKSISKFVVKTVFKVLKPLKYLKYLLLTPQGMYVVGLICGFLVKKITDYILFLGGNAKNGLSNLGIVIKESINKIIEKIKEKINNIAIKIGKKILNRHNELKDKDLTLSKDSFGIPKINDKDNYIKIKEKIEKRFVNWFVNYAEIFASDKEFEKKLNDIKEQIKKDLEKSGLSDISNKLKNYDIRDTFKSIGEKIEQIQYSDTLKQIQLFITETGTGILTNKLTRATVSNVAGTAIKGASIVLGAAIGSLFFGAGALIGGAIGGAIGGIIASITESIITTKMKLKLDTKTFNMIDDVIYGQNNLFASKSPILADLRREKLEIESRYRKNIGALGIDKTTTKIQKTNEYNDLIKKELTDSLKNNTIRYIFREIANDRLQAIDNSCILYNDYKNIYDYLNSGDSGHLKTDYKPINGFTGNSAVDDVLDNYAKGKRLILKKWIEYKSNNDINTDKKISPLIKILEDSESNAAATYQKSNRPYGRGGSSSYGYTLKDLLTNYKKKDFDSRRYKFTKAGGEVNVSGKMVSNGANVFDEMLKEIQKSYNQKDKDYETGFNKLLDDIKTDILKDPTKKLNYYTYMYVINKNKDKLRNIYNIKNGKEQERMEEKIENLYKEEIERRNIIKKRVEEQRKAEEKRINAMLKTFETTPGYEKIKEILLVDSKEKEEETHFLEKDIKQLFDKTVNCLEKNTKYINQLDEILVKKNTTIITKPNDTTNPNNTSD